MSKTKIFRIILRNDSTEKWMAVGDTTVLLKGEMGVEFLVDGTAKLKIGDGISTWNNLSYIDEEKIDKKQLEKIYESINKNKTDIQEISQRTSTVENSLDRVDYLVGELTNLSDTDAAAEVIQMRMDNSGKIYTTAGERVYAIEEKVIDLTDNISDYIGVKIPDNLFYEGNKLQLMSGDELIGDAITIVSGSGTGGGGNTYTVSLTNLLSSRIFSVTQEETVIIKFNYKSEDEEHFSDGPGVGVVTVNGLRKTNKSITQGDNEIDITQYLTVGENNVSIKVSNTEGSSRTLTYTINVIALKLTTTFPNMSLCTGPVGLEWRVTGIGTKQIYFILDGRQIGTETITANDVTRVFNIPTQLDGPHYLRVYVESTSDGVTVKSNELNIGLMWHSESTASPMIMFNYQEGEKVQGEILNIPYLVYNPQSSITPVTYNIYSEDGTLYSTQSGQVDAIGKIWTTQDYPAGQVKFEIVCGGKNNFVVIPIIPTTFDSTIITDSLLLEFTAKNRSNTEDNPEHWEYKGIKAEFSNFGWAGADGWIVNKQGHQVLRFLPDSFMEIFFKPFDTDIRSTGYTIEVELASNNVRDYDSTIITSYDSKRGFIVKSQRATLSSQSSSVTVQFKEDERVRVTFVVTKNSTKQMIYIYINGILCGVSPYPDNDNFKQPNPTNILIGAEDCGLDLYAMRFYNRAFSSKEQLNNFICDRSTMAERIAANKRNDILDLLNTENEEDIVLSFDKVKGLLPVLIMRCPKLPEVKGDDKIKGQYIEYIDQLHPEYSFTAEDCEFDVQGTSSAKYPVKNFKIKMKKGITYTASGEHADGWLYDKEKSLITKVFCLKADFASSEHSNNVNLVEFYNRTTPYKMPPQIIDSRVRQGVNGRPIILFWENSSEGEKKGELKCQGSYNMNDDKSNENTFGFVDIDITSLIPQPRIECWEWCNNSNDLCLFKGSDAFNQTKIDNETGKEYPAWQDDLEPRFPDLDDHMYGEKDGEFDVLRPMIDWVISTDPEQATNKTLSEPIELKHYTQGNLVTFTEDTAEYRLCKFKNEFEDYFYLNSMLYYYLFTEVFLLMDSRAKNMFLTTFDGKHFFPIPYDMDTAMGINNEGSLTFDYNCEDTDLVNEEQVFTGQQSVLWNNVRKCYYTELGSLYKELRANADNPFSYDAYIKIVNDHQEQWSEMCWNYDAQFKYLDTYEDGHASLAALQGNKKSQREWWLYNAFKYRDSKYHAGDAGKNFILIRTNGHGELTIVPYSHIYAEVEWGEAKTELKRATRNQPITFTTEGINNVFNLETHIFSADRISQIGDLSPFQVGYCDISAAKKLQVLKLGDSAETYSNGNLRGVVVSKNELLKEIDVSNCYNLGTNSEQGDQGDTKTIDASGCPCLEIFRAQGTSILGANFSNGGRLKEIYLPATITSLILRNQKNIEKLELAGYENIGTLCLENIPNIDVESLVESTTNLDRVRLIGMNWTATNEESLMKTINKLANCDGLSADGNDTLVKNPIVTGRVSISSISDESLQKINDLFPELIVVVNGIAKFFIRYVNHKNDLLYRYIANEGSSAIDPVNPPEGWPDDPISPPDQENTEDTRVKWIGWSELPTNIDKPHTIIATYEYTYRVLFVDDNGIPYEKATQWIKNGESAKEPVEAGLISVPTRVPTQESTYNWIGWDYDFSVITAPSIFKPEFNPTPQIYNVWFFNDSEELENIKVAYGSYATYPGDINAIVKKINGVESPYYTCIGWDKNPETTPIIGNTYFYAQFFFDGYITDSWQQIAEAAAEGNIEKYGLGGRKYIEYTIGTTTSIVEAEIVGIKHDTMATTSDDYNSGSSIATYSFILKDLGNDRYPYNITPKQAEGTNSGTHSNGGGWELSDLRTWLNSVLLSALPTDLQQAIKPVIKISDRGFYAQELNRTIDKIWVPSDAELNYENNGVVAGQGTLYPVYTDQASRKKICDEDVSLSIYWSRSTSNSNQNLGRYINTDGFMGTRACTLNCGIAWGFCI